MSRVKAFVRELQRRKVFKVASVYLITAWGASLGAAELLPAFGAPEWAVRGFVAFAILGFPIVVALAWAFDVTPEGVVRDPGLRRISGESPLVLASNEGSATTALFGVNGVVRVSWRDARGIANERSFDQAFSIGRDASCAIRFDDPLVSRRHVEVTFAGGYWWIADLGSRNGTLLDGQRVARTALPARGVVRLSEAGPALDMEVRAAAGSETMLAKTPVPPGPVP